MSYLSTGATDPDPCRHHWLLTSSDEASSGLCKKCGAQRRFTGGLPEEYSWHTERPSLFSGSANLPTALSS